MEKFKEIIKWIFVSNPKTIAAILTLVSAVVSFVTDKCTSMASVIHVSVGSAFALISAVLTAWIGLESNTEAEERKEEQEETAK